MCSPAAPGGAIAAPFRRNLPVSGARIVVKFCPMIRISHRGWWAAALLWVAAVGAAPADDTRVADAAMRADRAAVRTLVAQGASVNATQPDGTTALHWAARTDD